MLRVNFVNTTVKLFSPMHCTGVKTSIHTYTHAPLTTKRVGDNWSLEDTQSTSNRRKQKYSFHFSV